MNLLDNDLYAYTMAYFAYKNGYGYLPVTYELINRGTQNLSEGLDVDVLEHLLENLSAEKFTEDQLAYLYSTRFFSADFISFLRSEYKGPQVTLEQDEDISLTYTGPWAFAMFYETIILALINELYFIKSNPLNDLDLLAKANEKLFYKADLLSLHPEIKIMEFGTRRRRSRDWQEYIMTQLFYLCPKNILGTSNLRLARRYNLTPVGTIAHQIFMVLGEEKNDEILSDWEHTFDGQPHFLTLLPDTYTTSRFFERTTPDMYRNYKTVRIDSGDPFVIGDWILDQYQEVFEWMPKLIFSDSLTVPKMLELHDYFGNHILGFGYGTDLTNDVLDDALQIVIKPCRVGTRKCYKISDDPAKSR